WADAAGPQSGQLGSSPRRHVRPARRRAVDDKHIEPAVPSLWTGEGMSTHLPHAKGECRVNEPRVGATLRLIPKKDQPGLIAPCSACGRQARGLKTVCGRR